MRACRRLRGSVGGGWNAGAWPRATGACRCPTLARRSIGRQSDDERWLCTSQRTTGVPAPPAREWLQRRVGSRMLALQFQRSLPSYAIVKAAGGRPEVATSALSMLKLGDIAEPELPARDWVRVMPILSGICGSDLSAIGGHASLCLAPLTSYPFVPGHEVGGAPADGSRGVLQPALGSKGGGGGPPGPRGAGGRPGPFLHRHRGRVRVGA